MKKKKENLIYTLIMIVVVLGILLYKNNLKQKNLNLSDKGVFTVGKIINVAFPGRVSTSGYSYNYIYYVDNTAYEGGSLSDKKYSEGSYFEVTYLPETPEQSRMEFNRPVIIDSVCVYFEGNCPFKKE